MENRKNNQLTTLYRSYGEVSFDSLTVGPFGENHACAYAYKKTEKLLIALHLVTNLVPEKEPARNAIRDKSVCMLSDILYLRSGFHSVGSDKLEHVIASMYEMISLLNILHATGFVSDMNLTVLKEELSELIIFLRKVEGTEMSEKVALESKHFATDILHKGQYETKNIKDKSGTVQRDKRHGVRKSLSVSHEERRSTILRLLRNKPSINVKDISTVITDCSEKTIQRELMSLVKEGVLKKEGERRWSVYSLR